MRKKSIWFVFSSIIYNNLKDLQANDMDTNTNSTLDMSNNVSGTQTIVVEPFLDISKVEHTTKEFIPTRARALSIKYPKRYVENPGHKCKVNL